MSDPPPQLRAALAEHGLDAVLGAWPHLDARGRDRLAEQVALLDLAQLAALAAGEPNEVADGEVSPCPTIDAAHLDDQAMCEVGAAALHAHGVAVLTVAGGLGTRLGWAGPKGTFPATPVTGKSLFQLIAEQICDASAQFDAHVPWYIMTSEENDAATRAFLADNNWFGIPRGDVFLFSQGAMPAVDATGGCLLADAGGLSMGPDGHGGVVAALRVSGALEEMQARGVRHLSYVQVDNPLTKVIDPVFLGVHLQGEGSSAQATSKAIAKTDPSERVGVFCRREGRTCIIEYSDLPEDRASERADDGGLRFCAGSIATHVFATDFIAILAERGDEALPWHRALKRVPHLDLLTGDMVEPAEPNATRFERFIFDALPLADGSLVLEVAREDEFAPIKNAAGSDSPQTSFRAQSDLAGRWLAARGVEVPWDDEGHAAAMLEISPGIAASWGKGPDEELPDRIEPGEIFRL